MKKQILLIIAICSTQAGAMMHLPPQAPAQTNAICSTSGSANYALSDSTCTETLAAEKFEDTGIARAIKSGDLDAVKYELANKGWRGWLRWIFAHDDALTARAWRCLQYTMDTSPRDNKDIQEIVKCLCDHINQRAQIENNHVSRICAIRFFYDLKADIEINGYLPFAAEFWDFICVQRKKYMQCNPLETPSLICYPDMKERFEELCKNRMDDLNDALASAVNDGSPEQIHKLLDRGADMNSPISPTNIYWKGRTVNGIFLQPDSFLCRAAMEGRVEAVDLLIHRGTIRPSKLELPENLKDKDWKEVLHDLAVEVRNNKKTDNKEL